MIGLTLVLASLGANPEAAQPQEMVAVAQGPVRRAIQNRRARRVAQAPAAKPAIAVRGRAVAAAADVAVVLSWNPSVSSGVEKQNAKIVDANDPETIYTDVDLAPNVNILETTVPEGVVIIGVVTAVRGEEEASDQSPPLDVGFLPLLPPTNVTLAKQPTIQ